MTAQFNYQAVAPEAVAPLFQAGKALASSGLEPALLALVNIRASQINQCAFCLALHYREAEAFGERGDRLWGLPAWREASWYSARERAALEWTEALTALGSAGHDGELLARMRAHFSDRELVMLTLAITTINAWNRFNHAFGTPPEGAEHIFRMLHPAVATPA